MLKWCRYLLKEQWFVLSLAIYAMCFRFLMLWYILIAHFVCGFLYILRSYLVLSFPFFHFLFHCSLIACLIFNISCRFHWSVVRLLSLVCLLISLFFCFLICFFIALDVLMFWYSLYYEIQIWFLHACFL